MTIEHKVPYIVITVQKHNWIYLSTSVQNMVQLKLNLSHTISTENEH